MKAYVTLLSSVDYLPAVLILNETLKKVRSKYPLVVGITQNIFSQKIKKILEKNDIIVETIKTLEYSKNVKEKKKDLINTLKTASKISLFSLYDYEKLIYIDADVYVRENIDDLFNYKDGSILCYDCDISDNKQWGMSSLFVFIPQNHYFEEYALAMNAIEAFDGDFIGKMWFHIRDNREYRIPQNYMSFVEDEKLGKTIHLINPQNKFWLIAEPNFKKTSIEFDYYKLLNQIYLTNPEIQDIINLQK